MQVSSYPAAGRQGRRNRICALLGGQRLVDLSLEGVERLRTLE
jgi:hypothetical protein